MWVGIDLGTTNSAVAVFDHGAPRLLPNALGQRLTPSAVSLGDDGELLVGLAARERQSTHPELTATAFKRYMGSQHVTRLGKREFLPEELSALVLKQLKADAEAALGTEVTGAVITVPAYFNDRQRKATRRAGELAGLKVERLVNEPTAAALAHGIQQHGTESRFLVFDLGGGTFDVSVLELFEGVIEVRASTGDNFLGGEDFNNVLMQRLFAEFGVRFGLGRLVVAPLLLGDVLFEPCVHWSSPSWWGVAPVSGAAPWPPPLRLSRHRAEVFGVNVCACVASVCQADHLVGAARSPV